MLNANLACLNDRPLDRDLARRSGGPCGSPTTASASCCPRRSTAPRRRPPISIASRPDVVFGATLGTGVGGGIVVDGRVLTGENGAATEWSHTTLPFLRPHEHAPYVCFCGHADCIESFTSGRALVAWHRALGGGDVDGAEIGRRAAAGDAARDQAFALYEEALARALALVVNMLDPRAIVLGGGVSNNARIFDNVPKLWERWTVPKDLRTQAGARGARRRERRPRRRAALAGGRHRFSVSPAPGIDPSTAALARRDVGEGQAHLVAGLLAPGKRRRPGGVVVAAREVNDVAARDRAAAACSSRSPASGSSSAGCRSRTSNRRRACWTRQLDLGAVQVHVREDAPHRP